MANFNIKSKALADTTTLHLVDPATGEFMYADNDEKQPLTIELYGRSSKQYRQWMSATLRKNEKEKEANRGKPKAKSLEQTLADNAEFLSIVSIKATNFDLGGKAIDNKEAFVELYSDPSLEWIGEQVSEALGDNGRFLK
jgi:hypothetical protein